MRKFLHKIAFLVLIPLTVLLIISFVFLRYSRFDNLGKLNQYKEILQANKGKKFNILFIGDSSGENAMRSIDSNNINLCLSGSFGYSSQITFLKHIDQYITFDTIAVINTIDIPTRGVTKTPHLAISTVFDNPFKAFISSVRLINKALIIGSIKSCIYHKLPPYKITKHSTNTFSTIIKTAKINELVKLDNYLKNRREHFQLYFGPSLPYDTQYLNIVKDTIISRRISHMLNKPFLLDSITKGDSEDHIHPKCSFLSTIYYLKMIRKE